MIWDQDYDDHDNSIWTGASCFQDGGVRFNFRVIPKLENDSISWTVDGSDAEVLPTDAIDVKFATVDEAKRWCESVDAEAVLSEQCEG